MAISDATQQTRTTTWIVTADVVKAISLNIIFKSGGFSNAPGSDVQISLQYGDAKNNGDGTCELIRTASDAATGSGAVGVSGILSEATYNAVLSEVEAWLAANK